jgi:hypothetical protein
MYVAITRAWCRLGSREERRVHPLDYVLGAGFVGSVAQAPVDWRLVAVVCAKLASRYPWERDSGEPMPLSGPPVAPGDPLSRWWRALEGHGGVGVHYDELSGGTLEFLSVGEWEEQPGWGFTRE